MKLLKQQPPWTKERIIQFIQLNKTAASETSKTAYAKFLINQFVEHVILYPDDSEIRYHYGVVDKDGAPGGARTPDLQIRSLFIKILYGFITSYNSLKLLEYQGLNHYSAFYGIRTFEEIY